MSDILEDTVRQVPEIMDDYATWLETWKRLRSQRFDTVALARHDNRLAVLLLDRDTGELTPLSWAFHPPGAIPSPTAVGLCDAAAAEHRLAVEWPELGWTAPKPPPVHGKGVFVYPLGPVRADVAESVLYKLSVMGDDIVHVYVENGYKDRHIRTIVRGRTVAEALPVISLYTTTSNVHHSLAMALAVEQAWRVEVSEDIDTTRTLMGELERVYSHCSDLASLAVSTGLPVPQMEYLHLKEEVLRLNHSLFGHRYMRGSVVPGGLDTTLWPAGGSTVEAQKIVDRVSHQSTKIARDLEKTTSFLDRLHGAGVIPQAALESVHPVGPIGRASGLLVDIRQVRPYAAYHRFPITPALEQAADSYARFSVRIQELEASLAVIRAILGTWSREKSTAAAVANSVGSGAPAASIGAAVVEAPRGMLGYWVRFDPESGRIVDLAVATPSQRNWMVYAPAMASGNILQDFPIIDASFSLSVAGWDG